MLRHKLSLLRALASSNSATVSLDAAVKVCLWLTPVTSSHRLTDFRPETQHSPRRKLSSLSSLSRLPTFHLPGVRPVANRAINTDDANHLSQNARKTAHGSPNIA